MADCPNCPGGANLVFRLNPDAAAVDVAREENVVLIPQRLDPARVGIDQLLGMREITSLTNGQDYVMRWDDTRTFDDDGDLIDGDCGFSIVEPDGCMESMYDPSEMSEPTLTGFERDGALGISSASGCVTHVFCAGRWLCLEGQTSTLPRERVCYPDLTGQSYGGNIGSWLVFGDNQMERFQCPPRIRTFCVDNVEISASPSDNLSPPGGWGAVQWNDLRTNSPSGVDLIGSTSCELTLTNQSITNHRFRLEFFTPPGYRCPLELSWESFQSEEYFVGAWDSTSNTLLDATIVSEGAGSARVVSTATGDMVGVRSEIISDFIVRFDCEPSVDAERVRIVFANTGRIDTPPFDLGKQISDLRLTSELPLNGCFEWSSIEAQAAWMNQADPLGSGWLVLNGEVCKIVPPGQAAAYGALAGSQSSVSPSVSEVSF